MCYPDRPLWAVRPSRSRFSRPDVSNRRRRVPGRSLFVKWLPQCLRLIPSGPRAARIKPAYLFASGSGGDPSAVIICPLQTVPHLLRHHRTKLPFAVEFVAVGSHPDRVKGQIPQFLDDEGGGIDDLFLGYRNQCRNDRLRSSKSAIRSSSLRKRPISTSLP